jgi:hypothetical protein
MKTVAAAALRGCDGAVVWTASVLLLLLLLRLCTTHGIAILVCDLIGG